MEIFHLRISYSEPHTDTHARLSIVVIETHWYSRASYPNLYHQNEMPKPNPNPHPKTKS